MCVKPVTFMQGLLHRLGQIRVVGWTQKRADTRCERRSAFGTSTSEWPTIRAGWSSGQMAQRFSSCARSAALFYQKIEWVCQCSVLSVYGIGSVLQFHYLRYFSGSACP